MAVTLSANGYFEADAFTDLAGIVTHNSSIAKVGTTYYVRLNGTWSPMGRAAASKGIVAADSPYTVLDTDLVILANATAGPVTVNLPSAAGRAGWGFTVKKTDGTMNGVTLDPAGTETIDGLLTLPIPFQYVSRSVVSDGTNWLVT